MKTHLLSAALIALALPAMAEGTVDTSSWNQGGGEQDEALHLTPNHENAIEVYEVCSACHQLNGWGLDDGTFPQISGQHYTVIIKQLADIRALNRDNPTMYPFALPSEIGGSPSLRFSSMTRKPMSSKKRRYLPVRFLTRISKLASAPSYW